MSDVVRSILTQFTKLQPACDMGFELQNVGCEGMGENSIPFSEYLEEACVEIFKVAFFIFERKWGNGNGRKFRMEETFEFCLRSVPFRRRELRMSRTFVSLWKRQIIQIGIRLRPGQKLLV